MRGPARSPEALRRQQVEQRLRRRAAAATIAGTARAIGSLRIELRFAGVLPLPSAQVHVLHPAAPAWFEFACPCADCNGAFDLGAVIRRALAASGQRITGRLACSGTRPTQQLAHTPCAVEVSYVVRAAAQDPA